MSLKTKINGYVTVIKNRHYYTFLAWFITDIARIPFYFLPSPDGLKVLDEEWDYLILLDGCRFDTFEEISDISGDLKKVRSFGSSTICWLAENFKDYYEDIVYVSATPAVSRKVFHGFTGTDHFFEVIDAWRNSDKEFKVTLPDEVTRQALNTIKKYPDKRVIIHYEQPHIPYVGKTRILRSDDYDNYNENLSRIKIWDNELIQRAYRDNLRLVLGEVKKLISAMEPGKKIVITGDHGDHLGKIPFSLHPHHIHLGMLIDVPWLNVDKEVIGKEYEEMVGKNKLDNIIDNLKI
ncbi:MAG: hypothetical protein L6243_02550 [Candidatus Altiarchaeales archaeon]|nr:hypothetical protein [Candidatus Altiarchaeales archaeon]